MKKDPRKWRFEPAEWFDSEVQELECSSCHKKHPIGSEDFVIYWGNVTIGVSGGMIGNNLHNERLQRVTVICKDFACHEYLVKATCPDLCRERDTYKAMFEMMKAHSEYAYTYFWDEHPEDYDEPCLCATCRSYMEE